MLEGYKNVILQGTWMTLELALSALVLAIIIGLFGAAARLSAYRWLRAIGTTYTTVIRGIPDLVLMLLIFYGLQIAINQITNGLSLAHIDIAPLPAGIITLGFIYGAYFTETFRGAALAVPAGQREAAVAFGMSNWQCFRRIQFPLMMRFALPAIGNNWQVILKATALVSILGLEELVKATQLAGKSTWQPLFFALVAGAIYLIFTTVSQCILYGLTRYYSVGVKKVTL
ncbi:histidine ABC transporter permease HisQ [Rosenbergiella australiborealis]|uniref:Histidine ABC transporter permease HisQ n=1 Tax=Rosenbergiella australiborealis TaxID=1544696 RepID=A0ABS5T5L1_9GAMM|nr:histidine ABC transporter permease HisQ [Rosenbergiella australiborealis]MBT0726737.1 histidine ABC transporter permease HisQ [Rosenbergiella australiborealis]